MIRPPPSSPLFPSPTLSRSMRGKLPGGAQFPPQQQKRIRRFGNPAPDQGVEHIDRQDLQAVQGRRDGRKPPIGHEQRSEEHTSELQSRSDLVCRLLLEKKKK